MELQGQRSNIKSRNCHFFLAAQDIIKTFFNNHWLLMREISLLHWVRKISFTSWRQVERNENWYSMLFPNLAKRATLPKSQDQSWAFECLTWTTMLHTVTMNALILRKRKWLQQLHGSNSCWHRARFRAGMANLWHPHQSWHTTMVWVTHLHSPTSNINYSRKHDLFSHNLGNGERQFFWWQQWYKE